MVGRCGYCGRGATQEISHCSGGTPVGGQSQCHSPQCHMVIVCRACEAETYTGCRVPSHEGIGWGLRPFTGVL